MNTAAKFFDTKVNDQFFTIKFVKKSTGEIRTLNGRKGVKKYLKGTGKNTNPKHIRTVWDRSKREYRSFDVRNLIEVRCLNEVVQG